MTFETIPLEYGHLKKLLEEKHNQELALKDKLSPEFVQALLVYSRAVAGFVQGELVICGGISQLWPGRGYLWCVLSENIKKHPVVCFRGMRDYLRRQPFNRIEFDNPVGFEHGHRRALLFGFQQEVAVARRYLQNGKDASLYAWVRD